MEFLITFVIGFLVNFVGYLPFGNINLTVTQISINRGMRQVFYFLVPFTLVEVLFIYFIMKFVALLNTEGWMLEVLNWVMVPFFFLMAIITWFSRNKLPKADYKKKDSVKMGIFFGIVNPMIIPFWVFCGTFLIKNEWISDHLSQMIALSIGGALGAFLALYLFARFAIFIQQKFALSNALINKSIAILFFALALYQTSKQLYHQNQKSHWIKSFKSSPQK